MPAPSQSASYVAAGGLLVLLGAATVEQTGLVAGRTYEFTVSSAGTAGAGGGALARWGASDASIADGGFDFAIPSGSAIRSVCPAGITAINIIEAEGGTVATAVVLISEVEG